MRTLFWELVAGVTGVLVVATVIGAILGARSGGTSATIVNLNQRIRAWWAMIAIMAVAIGLGNNVTYQACGRPAARRQSGVFWRNSR